jgi:subtilase family serine protease
MLFRDLVSYEEAPPGGRAQIVVGGSIVLSSKRGRRRGQRLFVTVLTTGLLTLATATVGSDAAHAADRKAFPGSHPIWAMAANDAGAPPLDDLYEGEVQFSLQHVAGAERLATAVSTPGSALYGHPVTPSAWIARFSPPEKQIAATVAYLKSYGLTITAVPASRLFVVYRGSAEQMDSAFGVQMRLYRHGGRQDAAPSTAPELPASIAAGVEAVNLDQGRLATTSATTTQTGATGTAATGTPTTFDIPCSAYWRQHTASLPKAYGRTTFNTFSCGYAGPQFRSAYGASASLTGAGQTVATIIWYDSPTIVSDVNTWSARHGSPPLTKFDEVRPSQYYGRDECGTAQDEESLDIEAIHGLAPSAGVLFVSAADCDYMIDDALSKVLDHKLATIVSNSYSYLGEAPIDQVRAQENQHLQAAAEGIGLYYSSGDDGDDTDYGIPATPNYATTSPWVTAVGGTTTEIGKDGSIAAQAAWGDQLDQVVRSAHGLAYADPLPGEFYGGSGGGVSAVFAEPSYQLGVVPSSTAHGMRAEPDISADADPFSGLVVGFSPLLAGSKTRTGPYSESVFGGTSLASPLVAAEIALLQQRLGHPIGFANPLLYDLARTHRSVFEDVTSTKFSVAFQDSTTGHDFLVTTGLDTSLPAGPGWDVAAGIGSFNVSALAGVLTRKR